MTLSDNDIEKLQDMLETNTKHGRTDRTPNRLPVHQLEKLVSEIVTSSSQSRRTKHLQARESDETEPACEAKLSHNRSWTTKQLNWLNESWTWCDNCREIAYKRYRP